MTEKPKREKSKNDAQSVKSAILILAGLLVIGFATMLMLRPQSVDVENVVEAEPQVAISEDGTLAPGDGEIVTPAGEYPSDCSYMWQSGSDDDLTTALKAALDDAGIDYKEAVMNTYGEQEICTAEDGSYYDGDYLIMDYSPRITLVAAADEAGRGEQIIELFQPAAAMLIEQGKTLGYLDVIFNLADGEQEQWKATLGDLRQAIEDNPDDPAAIYALGQ
ncbi:MAG: hypothetical protein KC546_10525 [Anaerolineae bacterium]|nr:hypothetical protein [Anaerolineae bacterium]